MIKLKYIKEGKVITSEEIESDDYSLHTECNGNRTTILLHAKTPIELLSASIELKYKYQEHDNIFVNGYQSWTDTREFGIHESLHSMNHLPKSIKQKYHFEGYGDSNFIKYQKHKLHGFTYSYIRNRSNHASLIGSLNDNNAYLIINHYPKKNLIILESDCANKVVNSDFIIFDFVNLEGNYIEIQKKYFSNFGKTNAKKIKGYTSWYNEYQNINEEKILNALEGISNKHYDLFQIDDGYETYVGDWLDIDTKKFPNGLKPIVEKIHKKGLLAGIWLAPFVVETKSKIYQEHYDWIYQENGKEVYAGCNWSGQVVLDLNNKDVLNYIRKSLNYYLDLGFDFFKLDFLYAAALVKEDNKFTRAQTMREAMQFLRKILGDKLILGCGVPLSSAFGLVDYCRIGPDVSLKFDDVWFMKFMHRERISTKVTLVNTIYRTFMDGYVFRNDPDVYLLRDDNIELSEEQKRALITINYLCGAVAFTSDNVKDYNKEKTNILIEAQKLASAEVIDIIKRKKVITIKYLLNGEEKQIHYNSKKGVLVNG